MQIQMVGFGKEGGRDGGREGIGRVEREGGDRWSETCQWNRKGKNMTSTNLSCCM